MSWSFPWTDLFWFLGDNLCQIVCPASPSMFIILAVDMHHVAQTTSTSIFAYFMNAGEDKSLQVSDIG